MSIVNISKQQWLSSRTQYFFLKIKKNAGEKNPTHNPPLSHKLNQLLQHTVVRENRLKLTVRQLFTWNKVETFNMIKIQLQPAGKPSLSVARGALSEKYPHSHDGSYHLH